MKEVTKHSGKRSIGLPGIVSFLHVGKGSQGHVLDRSGPIWPTWNTPKKCFLSRKRPKEDERVGRGHFHERVDESPQRYENFGTNAFKKILFRFREKKSAGINKSVIVNHTAFSMEHNSCVGGMVDI